jgi:hypothetical protein
MRAPPWIKSTLGGAKMLLLCSGRRVIHASGCVSDSVPWIILRILDVYGAGDHLRRGDVFAELLHQQGLRLMAAVMSRPNVLAGGRRLMTNDTDSPSHVSHSLILWCFHSTTMESRIDSPTFPPTHALHMSS